MEGQLVLSAALLTTLSLELVKWVLRKWIIKQPEYDFPPLFYDLIIPFLTMLWSIALGYAGWGEPITPDFGGLLNWGLTIVASLAMYYLGVNPSKKYRSAYRAERDYRNNLG